MIATGPDRTALTLHLRPGRERSVTFQHPWLFTGAVARASGNADAPLVDVRDARGARIASGFHSPTSQIVGRLWTFGADGEVTPELVRSRIAASFERRRHFDASVTNTWRAVHAEGDRVPGLIVDRYADVLVVEIGSWGLEQWRDVVEETLRELTQCRGLVYRNAIPSRKIENLPLDDEIVGEVPDRVQVSENGLQFSVDVRGGQKTGLFLDQRDNRSLVRGLARRRRVLNLFAYTGGFGVYAAAGGAEAVTEVDVSASALEAVAVNHRLNGTRAEFFGEDAFDWARARVREGQKWDLIVCDPPAFARSARDVERASRGYKDINLQALRLCAPGALLATFSCSGHVDLDLFQKILFGAARDAGRSASILRRLGAGEDHPVSLYCPEGEYLKGLLLRVE